MERRRDELAGAAGQGINDNPTPVAANKNGVGTFTLSPRFILADKYVRFASGWVKWVEGVLPDTTGRQSRSRPDLNLCVSSEIFRKARAFRAAPRSVETGDLHGRSYFHEC
jgi:hypothetical protein